MKKESALKIILIISIAGILFSGYLSYTEIFAGYCGAAELGMGECSSLGGIPVCVYGFVMYLAVLIISILGLKSKNKK